MIRLAGQYGMVVFLDPIETGSWLSVLQSNGLGESLRLRPVPREALREVPEHRLDERQRLPGLEEPVVGRTRAGGREGNPEHRPPSHSHGRAQLHGQQFPGRREVATGDRARCRVHVQRHVRRGAQGVQPEARDSGLHGRSRLRGRAEHSSSISPGVPKTLRRQEYWTMLSGATGQLYGNHYTWQFLPDWKSHLDTPGTAADRLPREALRRAPVVSPRPGPEAHAAHLRLRNLLERRERAVQ